MSAFPQLSNADIDNHCVYFRAKVEAAPAVVGGAVLPDLFNGVLQIILVLALVMLVLWLFLVNNVLSSSKANGIEVVLKTPRPSL
jgi:hypothetical protein